MGLITDIIKKIFGGNSTIDNNSMYNTDYTNTDSNIPIKYRDFPVYPKKICDGPIEKITDKYERITMTYNGSPNKDYYETLLNNGYTRYSDIRYDKNNTYIIIEKKGFKTEIVFHIKK